MKTQPTRPHDLTSDQEWIDALHRHFQEVSSLRNALLAGERGASKKGCTCLHVLVPPTMPGAEWAQLRRALLALKDRPDLSRPAEMLIRRLDPAEMRPAGAYRMPWAKGVEVLLSVMRREVEAQPQGAYWQFFVTDSQDGNCPAGCAVVDALIVSGGVPVPVALDDTAFPEEAVPPSLRLISPCDACQDDEHVATVEGRRLCLGCLHGDDVPTTPVPSHLADLFRQVQGLGEARLILARNRDGQPVALAQTRDHGRWSPAAIELWPDSNGGDLHDFVMGNFQRKGGDER